MRLLNRLPLGIASVLLFALSCSPQNEITLANKNFDTQIEQQQNLVFEFATPAARPLVPDSLTGLWDSTQYVAITPRVAGSFKWTSPTTLVFSPSVGFKASTAYKAMLNDVLVSRITTPDGKKVGLPKERELSFHTPYLTLASADAAWTRRTPAVAGANATGAASGANAGTIEIHSELTFNYAVNPANLAERLRVTVDGKTIPFQMRTTAPAKQIVVGIQASKDAGGKQMTITIDKGLRCAESDYLTPEKLEMQVAVPATDDFKVALVATDYEEDTPVVRVFTTQGVEASNDELRGLVKIAPRPQNFDIALTENGFMLRGVFQPDTVYQLTVSRNLRGIFGVVLGGDFTQTVQFGSLQPGISFVEKKAMYLSSAGTRNIAVRITGAGRVKVIVEKIYENNILAYTRSGGEAYGEDGQPIGLGKTYKYDYDEATGDGQSYMDYNDVDDYGDPVFERTYDVKALPKQSGYHVLNLNFQDKLQSKGLYVVRVASTDQKWLRDSRLMAISDVGLIAKQGLDEMVVVANSIKTAEPLSGVEVRLITRNNQSPYKATTDKEGIARFAGIKQTTPGSQIAMVVASNSSDVNYLLLKNTRVETSRYDVGGLMENGAGLQAFIYGDRDMYRPGETIHLNTVVRKQDWTAAVGVPIKIKLLLPSGKDYATFKHTPNAEGAAETSINLPSAAMTGLYTVEAYTMNDVLLASRRLNVEEFLPDRISVTTRINAATLSAGEMLQCTATALNLFGPPATNRDYQLGVFLKRMEFSAKGFEKYRFTIRGGDNVALEEVQRQGKTDANGALAESVQISPAYRDIGLLGGVALVTVFDETGRPVNRAERFTLHTQDVYFGIKQFDRYASTRQPLQIPLVAIAKSGKVADGAQANVRVIRYNWQTVLEKDQYGGRYRYVSQKQEVTEYERVMTISGAGTALAFTPRQSGEYEVRVSKAGVKTYVAHEFYAYGYGDTQSSSFEVSKEGEIMIEAEKEQYKAGESAELLFKTPFAGKMLITVERDRVIEQHWVTTDQKSAKFSLPLTDAHVPNVYVSATLIKPLDDGSGSSMPLTVAYGFRSLTVEQPASRIPVSISVDEQTRSKTKKTITVSVASDAEMTIAVVDEGILQIKGFKTPDPHGFFYQKRALQVDGYNVYPYLFPDLKLRSSSQAGDAALLENRTNPMTNKRVKLIALWSGLLKASGGKASYTIDIPEFSGALRVMAVAYKGKSFGSAEKTVRVADPIVISSALPRFLSPNDEAMMPVTLTNTTNKPAQAAVRLDTKGAVRVVSAVGGAQQSVTIPPGGEAQVVFTVAAAQSVGTGEATVTVSSLGETFTQKTDLTVRPITSLLKTSGAGGIKAGGQAAFTMGGSYVQNSAKGKLVVSKSPIAQFTKNLSALVGYPYGCVEQTISRAFPQLYVADLARAVGQSSVGQTGSEKQEIAGNVQEAIRKLASMQLYNGGLSYWQGSAEESWWGSAYAAHFLIEAQKAGYDVSEEFQKRLYGYIGKKAKERNYEWYGYYDRAGAWRTKYIPAKTIFYSLYTLALAGRPDVSTMNFYKSTKDSLALDSRYLLAAAYFLAGDKGSHRYLLPKDFAGEKSGRAFGGSFYSYVRDEAIALNAVLETEPDNPQIGIMARHLSDALKNERYLNTQENAFALLALGKLTRRNADATVQASINAGGKQVQFTGADVVLAERSLAGSNVNISASGSGTLYYFWETEGISMEGKFVEEDSFLRVRKAFYTRGGQPLTADAIAQGAVKQNDLIVVKISLASMNGAAVENVVITDMLPAGLEIENPRVSAVPELSWIKDAAEPQHSDIRDDRISLFATADGTTRNYYYLCRAVSRGLYVMGPVSADAMYNGEYHSLSGAGVMRVAER
jgi:uncharacterized protein YfaS (alpha-2-macroglobulin family)